MTLFKSCLCFRDVKTGSVSSGTFTLSISFFQLLLQVALWTGKGNSDMIINYPPYLLYIPLAALDFLVIIFSMCLLFGVEKEYHSRMMLVPWVVTMVIYVLYEAAINLYFFSIMFPPAIEFATKGQYVLAVNSSIIDGLAKGGDLPMLGHLIVLLIYWAIKGVINVLAVLCVISRYQELKRHHKKHAHKHLNRSYGLDQHTNNNNGYDHGRQEPNNYEHGRQEPNNYDHGRQRNSREAPPSYYGDERRAYGYNPTDAKRYYDSYDPARAPHHPGGYDARENRQYPTYKY